MPLAFRYRRDCDRQPNLSKETLDEGVCRAWSLRSDGFSLIVGRTMPDPNRRDRQVDGLLRLLDHPDPWVAWAILGLVVVAGLVLMVLVFEGCWQIGPLGCLGIVAALLGGVLLWREAGTGPTVGVGVVPLVVLCIAAAKAEDDEEGGGGCLTRDAQWP